MTTTYNPTEHTATVHHNQQILEQIEELYNKITYTAQKESQKITCPRDIFNLLGYQLSALEQEELWTINMNTKNRILSLQRIYRGTVNESNVRIIELLRPAILDNATTMIIVHNHPSGDGTPSPEDVAITNRIHQACKLLDIDLLDHIIIAGGTYTSIKERVGLL